MKKIILLFLAIIILTFCGCAISNESTTSATTEQTTESPTVRVTFPEGYTTVQIAKKLEENKVCSAADFMEQINKIDELQDVYSFIKDIDKTSDRAFALEGYVFPDTYEFYKGESAASALARFLKNTDKKLTDEYFSRAKELGYTMDEIITIASVIQKEAGVKAEMPKVSSVLHNRLKSPDYGKLECDVTINYVNDYIIDSPYLEGDTQKFAALYNTYKCKGVPAGAICNPGIDAIKAALYPEDTDYFFFVTDKDKNYYYSKTYNEHLEYCKLFGLM